MNAGIGATPIAATSRPSDWSGRGPRCPDEDAAARWAMTAQYLLRKTHVVQPRRCWRTRRPAASGRSSPAGPRRRRRSSARPWLAGQVRSRAAGCDAAVDYSRATTGAGLPAGDRRQEGAGGSTTPVGRTTFLKSLDCAAPFGLVVVTAAHRGAGDRARGAEQEGLLFPRVRRCSRTTPTSARCARCRRRSRRSGRATSRLRSRALCSSTTRRPRIARPRRARAPRDPAPALRPRARRHPRPKRTEVRAIRFVTAALLAVLARLRGARCGPGDARPENPSRRPAGARAGERADLRRRGAGARVCPPQGSRRRHRSRSGRSSAAGARRRAAARAIRCRLRGGHAGPVRSGGRCVSRTRRPSG